MPCFFAIDLDKAVVVRVFKAGLQRVVIDVGHAERSVFTRGNAHRLKFKVCHGAGCILRQRLVNAQANVGANRHFSAHKMIPDDLLCDGKSHEGSLLTLSFRSGGGKRALGPAAFPDFDLAE